jgi:hypothetical protein
MKNLYKIDDELYIISNTENVNENCWIITNGKLVQVSYLLSNEVAKGNKIILTTNKLLIKDGIQAIDDEFLQWFIENQSCEKVEVVDLLAEQFGYIIIIPKEEPKQENKVLVEMQQILRRDSKFMGHYESCDLCHYNAFFKYLYNGEILYRCQGHKIVNINNLKSKFGFGSEEPKQETLEEAADKLSDELHAVFEMNNEDAFLWILNILNKGATWQAERMYSEEEVKHLINSLVKDCYFMQEPNQNVSEWFEQFKKK